MFTFVRSMMVWLGVTMDKDVSEETSGNRSSKRRRDDDVVEAAFALRFK